MDRTMISHAGKAIIVFLLFALSSCAAHMTQEVGSNLRPSVMSAVYQDRATDLRHPSRCPSTPSVSIINAELRDIDYQVRELPGKRWYINPKELAGYIVPYMREAYGQCRVVNDPTSTKVIRLSIQNVVTKIHWLSGAQITVKIEIPELQLERLFSTEEWTIHGMSQALAYAIHLTTWEVIRDSEIQDYILCR